MLDRDRARRFLPALCLATLPAFALACSPQTPAKSAAEAGATVSPQPETAQNSQPASPQGGEKPPAAQTPEASAPSSPGNAQRPKGFDFPSEPPDGKWLTDDQGRRYFVHEVAKIEGTYTRMFNNTRVKFWWTPPFELVKEDDQSFYVKIYGLGASPPPAARAAVSTPEQVAASYTVDAPESDRLRLVPWSQGLPTRGQWRQGFDLADVNGDGQTDIVHGPPRKGGTAPAIFLGDGKGRWKRWGGLKMPDLELDYGDAAAADFNGDGVADLAFASHLRGLSVLVGDGKGGFKPWGKGLDFLVPGQDGAAQPSFSSRAIEVVDWNKDGRPDLLALSEGPTLNVARSGGSAAYNRGTRGAVLYVNQGDGTWRRVESGGVSFGDALVVGRFAGDDKIDFVSASASQGNRDLLYVGREDGTWQETTLEGVRPNATFRGIAAADFDGDGREDLAVGYASSELDVWRTGVDVLLARPNGKWERRPLGVTESSTGVWGLDAGDLDGDGAADLVASTGSGELWVFLGNGKGSFTRERSPELALPDLTGCTGYHVALKDMDGDGASEVVASFAGEGDLGDALAGGTPKCSTGGSLRAWKAVRESGR